MRKFFILCAAAAALAAPAAQATTVNATTPAPGDAPYQLARLQNEVTSLQMQVDTLKNQNPVQNGEASDAGQLITTGG